jgi:lipopolysaccharide exporter
VLMSGTAMSQAIVLLVTPILSRIYDPSAYGVLAVVMSVGGPFMEVASLKYEIAIVQAKEEKDAANLFLLSAAVVVLMALITTCVVAVAGDWIAEEMGNSAAAGLMYFSPALILCVGLINVIVCWSNRRRAYRTISTSEICRSISVGVLQIGLGLIESAARDLATGRLMGQIVALIYLCRRLGRQDWTFILQSFRFATIKKLIREHSQFPKYSVPREFLISVSSSATPVLLALYISPASAGLYWFADRILEAPKTLIGKAVRRVFFQRAVVLHHNNESMLPLLVRTTACLAALAIIPTAVIFFFGPDLFDLAFGAKWREAGVYAQWLMIWWMSSFYASGAMTMVSILNIQRATLLMEIAGLSLRLGALVVGVVMSSDIITIALYSMAGFTINTVRLVHIFYHVVKQAPGR